LRGKGKGFFFFFFGGGGAPLVPSLLLPSLINTSAIGILNSSLEMPSFS